VEPSLSLEFDAELLLLAQLVIEGGRQGREGEEVEEGGEEEGGEAVRLPMGGVELDAAATFVGVEWAELPAADEERLLRFARLVGLSS